MLYYCTNILYPKSGKCRVGRENVPLHSTGRYVATTSFIKHLPYNVYHKGADDEFEVVQTSHFLNGCLIEKQIF